MKNICGIVLFLLLISNFAYGDTSFTKTWSDTDNGSTFDGSDIGDIQSDIVSQSVDKTGTQTVSGNKTFSGTVAFTGTVTGVGGGAKDAISRGFELVWDGPPQVLINPGTLYNGTTQVDLTSQTHVEVTTNGDWIDGSAKDYSGGAGWANVYVGTTSAAIYFDENDPNSADTSGNTAGTKYYYTTGGNYYRWIGAVRINTSNQVAAVFIQQNGFVEWANVVSVNTTVYDDVWSAAVSCSSAMPAFSTFAKFKLSVQKNAGMVAVTLRPFGINSTSYTTANGVLMYTGDNSLAVSTIIDCATDSSQQISIQHHNNPGTVDVSVVGYYIDR